MHRICLVMAAVIGIGCGAVAAADESPGRVGPGGPPPGPGGPPPGPGGPGAFSPFGMPGMYGSGSMNTLTESQLTAGLVELTVYGIVSLYEKYEAPAAAADQPAK